MTKIVDPGSIRKLLESISSYKVAMEKPFDQEEI
jgi:hypothetical protein